MSNTDWSKKYNYNFPTSIRFGKGVIEELGDHLKAEAVKRTLLVTDSGLFKLPVFKKIQDILEKNKIAVTPFYDLHKNPVKSDVKKGVDAYKLNKCDNIVGLGGGAAMDVARAIALWANHPENDLFDFDDAKGGDKFVTNPIPYFVTVPTTSGTGSEVGRSTVISDDDTHAKKILFSPKLLAKKVFADPELTMELPAFITAATGLDALTHNLEAYIAQGVSPLCEGIALEGIRLIFDSLQTATKNPDLESRAKMQMAALMGATAFQKGLGVVHSLAHPLSTVFDMHHGLANAIMLNHGMEFNLSVCEEKFMRIMSYLGLRAKSGEEFISYLNAFNLKLNMPTTLKGHVTAWTEKEKNRLYDLAVEDPCHASNPRPVTRADFIKLYEHAYHA